jgi:hypothetical protein
MALSAEMSDAHAWDVPGNRRQFRTQVDVMMTKRHRPPFSRFAGASIALEILLSIGALGGGLILIVAPRGEIIPLPLSALRGSPFDTYLVPGMILFAVLGFGPLVAAALAWRRHPLAPLAAIGTGVALLIWLTVEVAIVGWSNDPPLQPIYLALGIAITVLGTTWVASVKHSALLWHVTAR